MPGRYIKGSGFGVWGKGAGFRALWVSEKTQITITNAFAGGHTVD